MIDIIILAVSGTYIGANLYKLHIRYYLPHFVLKKLDNTSEILYLSKCGNRTEVMIGKLNM